MKYLNGAFPPPFTGEVLSEHFASEAEGAASAFAPLPAFGGTPPVNGGRNRGAYS